MGVAGATERFPAGATVVVDGSTGDVVVVVVGAWRTPRSPGYGPTSPPAGTFPSPFRNLRIDRIEGRWSRLAARRGSMAS
ncbi:MAG: hypothetical protein ACRD0S_02335 [Acidimicrobiales bacterium]